MRETEQTFGIIRFCLKVTKYLFYKSLIKVKVLMNCGAYDTNLRLKVQYPTKKSEQRFFCFKPPIHTSGNCVWLFYINLGG
jgi:hypothetical protein